MELTEGSVNIINCLFAVDTKRFVLSLFRATVVISCPSASFNVWRTCYDKTVKSQIITQRNEVNSKQSVSS